MRIEKKPAFSVSGVKTRISGQHNGEFGDFWNKRNNDGTSERIKAESSDPEKNDAMALIRAEMEAFINWLPKCEYRHYFRPEIEVYPEGTGVYAEFWLPILK